MPVANHDQKRKKCARTGWKSTPRCDWARCRYSVIVRIVSWVTTSRYAIQVPQEAWVSPRDAKEIKVSNMMRRCVLRVRDDCTCLLYTSDAADDLTRVDIG